MMCSRCWAGQKLVFGALLLLNAFVWPNWLGVDGWVAFLAVLMVLGGFLKLVLPSCPHCSGGTCEVKPAAKGKRKKR